MYVLHATLLQNPTVGIPKVYVPFMGMGGIGKLRCYARHGETLGEEAFIDFVADLKGLERNARTYDGGEV